MRYMRLMELIGIVLRGISVLLSLIKLVYDVHKDKKRAATDCNSDGSATK